MNKSDKELLASILEKVLDAICTGKTSELDSVIKDLKDGINIKYPDAPEGATHIDLNDTTYTKWIKVVGDCFYHYTIDQCWFVMNPEDHDMDLEEL